MTYEPPRTPQGTIDWPRTAAQTCHAMGPLGSALIDCASRLAYINELMPKRGELFEEFKELVTTLAWIETTYQDANQRLLDVATTIDHEHRVPEPLPMDEA